jgi:proteasome lid subunit RPN8/RPN11
MLTISDEHKDAIRAHGELGYPEEICGFLIGQASGDDKAVVSLLPIENIREENRGRRFEISPDDFYQADAQARHDGQAILGFYHSHPDHPARPSEYDREHAWPWYSYIIVSVEKGRAADLTSWVLRDGGSQFDCEEIAPDVARPGG